MTHATDTDITLDELAALRLDPPRCGQLASARVLADFEGRVEVRDAQEGSTKAWPDPKSLRPGRCLALEIEPSEAGARAWLDWLDRLALTLSRPLEGAALRVAPCTAQPAGTFRLWAIAAARLRLPPQVRVEARHDLIGIRLAQVALGFGADTLAGPIDADRHLPLAGVTRPNESTRAGLFALIEQSGRTPVDAPGVVEHSAELTTTPVVPSRAQTERILA